MPDGRTRNCTPCAKRYERDRWGSLSEEKKREINDTKKRRKRNLYNKVVEYLTTHPCVDCGEPDPVVLEFDHVRGTKCFNIGDAMRQGYGPTKVWAEIEKCEVRCANCHRRITHNRRQNEV